MDNSGDELEADQATARKHFKIMQFVMECGLKLHLRSVTLATASILYHKFFQNCSLDEYDPYLIATAAIYLAGKVEEQHLKIRDVVNVCYRTLHKDRPALEIGDLYWTLKESVVNAELLLMRMMKYSVEFEHPHKYMLHYLKSLSDWVEENTWSQAPVATTAWALLRDSYHGSVCLKYKPQHVAVAVIYLALQSQAVEIPFSPTAETKWWEALCEDIQISTIKKIIHDLIDLYNLETTVAS